VGDGRRNCTISDEMVRWLRDKHEQEHLGWRRLARMTGLRPKTVRKILAYERRSSAPATWKRVDDGEEG